MSWKADPLSDPQSRQGANAQPGLSSPRPATRVGRTVLHPGGAVIQLSRIQRVLFALGLRTTLSTPHQKENV